MNKKSKVVKTYGAVHKRRLPVILAVAAILVAAGIIIGMNIYDEYHTYRSSEATEFEMTAEDLYLVRDLASISWGAEEESVVLTQKDGSSVIYVRAGDRWEKESR